MKLLLFPFRVLWFLLRLVLTPWYLRWLFYLPWFLTGVLVLGCGYLTYLLYQDLQIERAETREALAAPLPPLVAISEFEAARHAGPQGELRVRAYYQPTRLPRRVSVIGPDQAIAPLVDAQGTVVAVLVFLTVERDDLRSLFRAQRPNATAQRWLVDVHGSLTTSLASTGEIKAELAKEDLRTVAEPLLIKPFVKGRAAGIDRTEGGEILTYVMGGLTLVFFFLTLYQRHNARLTRAERQYRRTAKQAAKARQRQVRQAAQSPEPVAKPMRSNSTPKRKHELPKVARSKPLPTRTETGPHRGAKPLDAPVVPARPAKAPLSSADEIILRTFGPNAKRFQIRK